MAGAGLAAEEVLDRLRGNVIVVAADGTIRAAYGGRGEMAGHPNASLAGRNALEVLAPASHAALIDVFLSDAPVPIMEQPISFPVQVLRPDGGVEDFDLTPTGFDVGDDQGWVVVLTSRHHLPPAAEVLHSISRGDSLVETAQAVATHMSLDLPAMPEVVRRTIGIVRPGTDESRVVPGRPGPLADAVTRLVARRSSLLWDLLDPTAITNVDVDVLPQFIRDAMAAEDTIQLIGLRIDGRSVPTLVLLSFVRDPNAPGLLGNTKLALEDLRVALCRAIEREEGQRALELAASTDTLTGLLNRAGFHRRALSAEPGSSVIYVDLDGFKAVNDTHGHAVGDAVLAEVARRLRAVCRPDDSIARLGGDEFAVIVDVDMFGARAVAQRLLAALAADLPEGLGPRSITASIGIASVDDRDALDDAIAAADHAMLAAKRAGKARIDTAADPV